ncbi:hypothetical protein [Celeribacter halophilus]|uniref:hypothetical protein n=1 Tax=Celeribacter halophilus TaxID=576117 RepID=UPI003A911A7C
MKKALTTSLLACALPVLPAFAQTCVGAGFDIPLPGATAVETRHVDIPSPTYPGIWQEGTVRNFFYRIYANGEAALSPSASNSDWEITVLCDAGTCQKSVTGTAPQAALDTADLLEACLLGGDAAQQLLAAEPDGTAPPPDGTVPALVQDNPPESPTPAPQAPLSEDSTTPDTVAPEPSPQIIEETAPVTPVPVKDTAPCGLAAIPEGPPGITLQRLLVEAGENPGPLDGIPGRRTRTALQNLFGAQSVNMDTAEAITALDNLLCQ